MSRFTVVLDACVLYPAPLRDVLLSLASARMFRARWTTEIEDEWFRNLTANRPDLDPDRLRRTIGLMREAGGEALIANYKSLIPSIELPDPDDRHVIAAAIRSSADAIVTANLKDFPPEALTPYDLEAIHPDDFLINQIDLNLGTVLSAIREMRQRLQNPQKSADELLETLVANGLPRFAATLRQYSALI